MLHPSFFAFQLRLENTKLSLYNIFNILTDNEGMNVP